MNDIDKLLRKLNTKQRDRIEAALLRLYSNKLAGLSVKKLKGHENIYRIRVGDYRIIYRQTGQNIELIDVVKRDDKTYRDF